MRMSSWPVPSRSASTGGDQCLGPGFGLWPVAARGVGTAAKAPSWRVLAHRKPGNGRPWLSQA